MNYLAHIYLARHSYDAMLGALLGDFVKTEGAASYQSTIAREILLHRKIDSYTDQHPLTLAARSMFAPTRRRYAGIALDIFYDHILAKEWHQYSDQHLAIFVQDFYRELMARQALFNPSMEYAAPRMVAQDWLGSYIEFDGVKIAIDRVSTRLSRNGHLLRETVQDLTLHYDDLREGFLLFFPELQNFVNEQRSAFIRYELDSE